MRNGGNIMRPCNNTAASRVSHCCHIHFTLLLNLKCSIFNTGALHNHVGGSTGPGGTIFHGGS